MSNYNSDYDMPRVAYDALIECMVCYATIPRIVGAETHICRGSCKTVFAAHMYDNSNSNAIDTCGSCHANCPRIIGTDKDNCSGCGASYKQNYPGARLHLGSLYDSEPNHVDIAEELFAGEENFMIALYRKILELRHDFKYHELTLYKPLPTSTPVDVTLTRLTNVY